VAIDVCLNGSEPRVNEDVASVCIIRLGLARRLSKSVAQEPRDIRTAFNMIVK
jgi:hypothetical protein